ncbi:MAG TPA: hypothetical protein VF170_00200, partial [Planctomycetaceae bacterium]
VGDCRTVLPVCWDNIVQLGDTTTNYQLMPGDRVFVPASGCFDMVFGFLKCRKDCPRCCYPQCPAGYASVKCPYPNCYDLGCPPYPGLCPPAVAPTIAPDGVPPEPAGPSVVPPAAPRVEEPGFDPEPAAAPVSMIWRRGVRTQP